jgi:hypothetical protein
MTIEQIDRQNQIKIASMHFQTIVAEDKGNRQVTLNLDTTGGIQGFIVLVRPALPCID